MQRLLSSSKLVSELQNTLSRPSPSSNRFTTSIAFSQSIPNTQSHLATSPISQLHHRHPFSLLALFSSQRPSSVVLQQLRFYGRVLNPVLTKHLLSNSLLKGSIKNNTFYDSTIRFVRTRWNNKSYRVDPQFSRGWRSWSRRFTTDGVVYGLIMANVAVFFLWQLTDRDFMYRNFMISVENVRSGRIHTLITSAFSHADLGHIASNMIGLYFFGQSIGSALGPQFLLKLYFSGALVGSIFYLVHHAYLAQLLKEQRRRGMDPARVPGLGASGAVNAIMLLNIFLFPKSTLYFDFIIPVPAILLGIFLVGKDVLRIIEGDPQISGAAHLGGAAVAAVTWLRLHRSMRF